MSELAKLTWTEARERTSRDVVALLPIGAIEPHGPHLTLDADVTIALAQARAAAEELERLGVRTLVLPALPFGLTHFTDGFAGRLSLHPGTLWSVLEDVVESLEDWGIRRVVFANAHLEPAHVEVLRGVAMDRPQLDATHAHIVFPDNTRRRWAETLGEEFRSGDCHAGRYESSLVLAAEPASVREGARRALAPVTIHLLEQMKAGTKSFARAGATQAYCGDPAAASAVEGAELLRALAAMIVASVREAWPELFRS
jgi:creatinine amidohydrolase